MGSMPGTELILERAQRVIEACGRADRPCATLSYAQSLDGCITAQAGESTRISGEESMVLTHQLRAAHQAILVGVGTVLVDDPRLDVRLTEGQDPRVVIVDSGLRTPTHARCLQLERATPWIATTSRASEESRERLQQVGARVVTTAQNSTGGVDLEEVLRQLAAEGVRSVMIEGGAGIITSMLAAGLADQVVLTIAPTMLGGVRAVQDLRQLGSADLRPRLEQVTTHPLGDDWIVHGVFRGHGMTS